MYFLTKEYFVLSSVTEQTANNDDFNFYLRCYTECIAFCLQTHSVFNVACICFCISFIYFINHTALCSTVTSMKIMPEYFHL